MSHCVKWQTKELLENQLEEKRSAREELELLIEK